jgi:hypothetical protein
VKQSGANILNSFFDIAKQTDDDELLQTAADISKSIYNMFPSIQHPGNVEPVIVNPPTMQSGSTVFTALGKQGT